MEDAPERTYAPVPYWYDAMWYALEEGPDPEQRGLAGRAEDDLTEEEE